jgi:hypothetical protein
MKKSTLREYIKSQIRKTLNEDVQSQWGTMTYDERLDILLSAIKDPDEADHWANTEEFTNLPPQVQSIFDHPEDEYDLSASQDDIGVDVGDEDTRPEDISQLEGTCGYKYDAVTGRKRKNTPGGLEETVNETVNFEGEEYDIISKDGDWVYLRSIHDTQIGRKEIKVKEKDIKYLDEVSALESYVKEAIKEYMKGTPWSHGIAVGHRINKYNDPELIRKRYDKAAEGGFKGRPKGRLSNPRGYSLNEEDAEKLLNWAGLKDVQEKEITDKRAIYTTTSLPEYVKNQLQTSGPEWKNYYKSYNVLNAGGGLTQIVFHKFTPDSEPVNEFKDCNCGCDDYEETFLREYIQKYIAPKIT